MTDDRTLDEGVSRRVVGWLVLLGSPGFFAGIWVTLYLVPFGLSGGATPATAFRTGFAIWGAAASASAVGGSLVATGPARPGMRVAAGVGGFLFGAAAFPAVVASFASLTE